MNWRLGLDIGTNSIGWWAFKIKRGQSGSWSTTHASGGGVLIFPDGREPAARGRVGDSLAVARRMDRGIRRNRDVLAP